MPEAPTYLRLLTGIAAAESRAHAYLSCWAETTSNQDLKATLQKVALREGEHGMSFAKRVNELGFECPPQDEAKLAEKMAIAASDISDIEKAEKLDVVPYLGDDALSFFDNVFADHSIDIRTGELLGRYIAEEHDTVRLFRGCYRALQEDTGAASAPASGDLAALDIKVDALCRAVEELRQIVCAQTMPTNVG